MLKSAIIVALVISANCLLTSEASKFSDRFKPKRLTKLFDCFSKSCSDAEEHNVLEGSPGAVLDSEPEDSAAPSEPTAYLIVDDYLLRKTDSDNLKENIEAARELLDSKMAKERSQVHRIATYLSELAEEQICDTQNLISAVVGLRYTTGINKDMFEDVYRHNRLSRVWADYVDRLWTECEPEFELKWKHLHAGKVASVAAIYEKKLKFLDSLNGRFYAGQYEGERRDLLELSGAWRNLERYSFESSAKQFEYSLNFLINNNEQKLREKFHPVEGIWSERSIDLWRKELIKPCLALVERPEGRSILTAAAALGYSLILTQSSGSKPVSPEGQPVYTIRWAARYLTCEQLISGFKEFEINYSIHQAWAYDRPS